MQTKADVHVVERTQRALPDKCRQQVQQQIIIRQVAENPTRLAGIRGETMRNRGQSRQRRGRSGRGTRRAAEDDEAAATAAALSDSDLDEDLLDYLQNVYKQDSSDDDESQPQQHMQPGSSNAETVPAQRSAAQPGSSLGDPADAEDPDSWRPTGLGYNSQHGFASASAAAQFADTPLDHMLEGNLARDMQRGREDDSSGSSSSSSEGSDSSGFDSDTDTTSSGSSDSEQDEEGIAGSCFGASEPVVVDASGRQQRWHDLSLEQRFPVQSRKGLSSPAAAAAGSSGGKSARGSKQMQRAPSGSMRNALAQNISTSMLLSNRQGSIPEFQSEGLAAAVAAATTAAAELAKQQVAQYAELAQQLQQAKQNQRQRPGRQGKGVKKQLKKAKVAAKRTAREARSEAGALQLLAALEAFVGSGQDMQVLPPCGSRQKEGFAKQLARLFGVIASSQGGGSSGRTCLVLQATLDLQPQPQQQLMDESRLSQLQVLLRGELAKELAAATIARDDTVHNLKKKEKQRRRSSQQQQSGMQRQGSRGPPGRVPTPDYQQPVMFVAAGVLDPNSSLMNHDEYMGSDTAAAAAAAAGSAGDTESGTSSSSDDGASDPGSDGDAGVGRAAAAAAAGRASVGGATGLSHAEVGAFLESLLLHEEEQETSLVDPAAAAAAAQGPQEQDERPVWFIDRAGSPLQEGVTGRGGLGFSAVAADNMEMYATSLAEDPQQQQQQQDAHADMHAPGSSSAAFVPTWFEDKGPERTVYSQGGRGLTFIAAGTSDDDFAKHKRMVASSSAAAAAAAAAAGLRTGDREEHEEGPVYDRAGLGLGFGLGAGRPGLGVGPAAAAAAAAETDIDVLLGLPREGEEDEDSDGGGWERAGLGRRQGHRKGANSGRDRVAQLEAEFQSLQTPGGRAAAAAAAGEGQPVGEGSKQERKQRRKQQRQQQQQQQRAHEVGNANLDAWMLAAGATAAAVDAQPSFNMTAQQSKKAKKQQQRNQRREAKAAGGAGSPAAAEGVGMQQQQAVGFATFEVHTTGIGSRLLSRWGWSEGEGLGRARQGRANPLQAERRPKQLGLGYE